MCKYCDSTTRNLVEIYEDSFDSEGNPWIKFDAYIEDGFLVCVQHDQDTMWIDSDCIEIKYCPMCGRDLMEKEDGKPKTCYSAPESKTVYCVTTTDTLTDDEECTFYDTPEEAREAAEIDASYDDRTMYVHELARVRMFRTEPVITYDLLEVL